LLFRRVASETTHPVLLKYAEERASSLQNRVADAITAFAGSMLFVYIHIVVFTWWILTDGHPLLNDPFPFGLLTMVVSLEAIFLSTFVMVSQNRADVRRQLIADNQWRLTQQQWKENDEILALSQQVFDLSKEIHALTQQVHAAVGASKDSPTG
jgi:uncharacterized membrane protein